MIGVWPNAARVWPRVWHRGAGNGPRRILFTKPWVFHWSWMRRPAFLTSDAPQSDTLFAGPWVGEFGWELMNWQGLVRAQRARYKRVIVSSRASSAPLYEGVCDSFIPHEIKGQANSHVVFQMENPSELHRILSRVPEGADVLLPLRYVPASAQRFERLGHPARAPQGVDVLFHARGRDYEAGRNWPASRWAALAEVLRAEGFGVGSIGLSHDAWAVPGTEDMRDQPLGQTLDVLASARLVVGPSSGPMHLASLCGAPHLVWTDRRTYGMGLTSRAKYESAWNPLDTPVCVLDEHGFDPPADLVQRVALRMLRGES